MIHNKEIEINAYTDFAHGYARFIYIKHQWQMVEIEVVSDTPKCTLDQLEDLKAACWDQLNSELELFDRIDSF